MRVGADVRAECGHCGEVWHVVVALVGVEIAQVECGDCGRRHRYRRQSGKPRSSARTRPAPAPPVQANPKRPARGYDPRARYETGDRVSHPRFGEGVVQTLAGATKMRVLFASGTRLLVHGRN